MNRTLHALGEAEMEALQHVWDLGRATVADVHARVLATREVAYTTVMSALRKLARKGYLRYDKDGAAYVYSAARPPDEVRAELLRGLIDKAFAGSTPALVQTLVRHEPLSPAAAEALGALLDAVRDADDASADADANASADPDGR